MNLRFNGQFLNKLPGSGCTLEFNFDTELLLYIKHLYWINLK